MGAVARGCGLDGVLNVGPHAGLAEPKATVYRATSRAQRPGTGLACSVWSEDRGGRGFGRRRGHVPTARCNVSSDRPRAGGHLRRKVAKAIGAIVSLSTRLGASPWDVATAPRAIHERGEKRRRTGLLRRNLGQVRKGLELFAERVHLGCALGAQLPERVVHKLPRLERRRAEPTAPDTAAWWGGRRLGAGDRHRQAHRRGRAPRRCGQRLLFVDLCRRPRWRVFSGSLDANRLSGRWLVEQPLKTRIAKRPVGHLVRCGCGELNLTRLALHR
jgi:hypothetical protein